jgi:hypothetical protein
MYFRKTYRVFLFIYYESLLGSSLEYDTDFGTGCGGVPRILWPETEILSWTNFPHPWGLLVHSDPSIHAEPRRLLCSTSLKNMIQYLQQCCHIGNFPSKIEILSRPWIFYTIVAMIDSFVRWCSFSLYTWALVFPFGNMSIVFCICFDGVVIAAQCTATFKIYCAPPNLGITKTWICRLNFAQMSIFSGLRFFNEPEISDWGPPA